MDTGISTLKSFHYSQSGHCVATLENGISGIIGSTTACPLGVLLTLKGIKAPIRYTEGSDWKNPKDGQVRKNYRLEWSLE